MPVTYPPPLDQLLTLGEPASGEWPDYRALGLGDEHVTALIELMRDERLEWSKLGEGEDEAPFWAPVHAWRALGQLRAAAAVEALVRRLPRENAQDDWAAEEIPVVLGMIGPAALRPVRDELPVAARGGDFMLVARLGSALVKIARSHPETRPLVVETLTRQLRVWSAQDEMLNAFLISDLLDLQAVEAAPVMQEAFEAGAVDESVAGDWEEVQVELALLPERITPPPRYDHGLPGELLRALRDTPVPGSPSAAARSSQLRKAQKQSRRKRRR